MQNYNESQFVNVGSDEEYTIKDLVELLKKEIFSSDLTITTVNGVAYRVEFFCPNAVASTGGYGVIKLTNGSGTVLSRFGTFGNVALETPLYFVTYFTATGTSTTFNVLFRAEGTGTLTLRAGNGWSNYATWRVNLEIFDGMTPSF